MCLRLNKSLNHAVITLSILLHLMNSEIDLCKKKNRNLCGCF